MSNEMAERVGAKFLQSGCEKLPEGPMRDNCEKKKGDGGDDKKKEAKKGEVPEAFKKEWKNKDKDNDGKENEPKPDFLKEKEKKSSEPVPEGVVAAMTQEGKIEIFEVETPKAATALKEAMKANGGYVRLASGPNVDKRTASELYDDFEQRWASDDEEADEDSDEE